MNMSSSLSRPISKPMPRPIDELLARPGAGGTSLLLDTFTGAAAAYSLRKLRTAYAGACVRIRRSSDNTEQDIGFSGNSFDAAAFSAFIGAGNGFITTLYDQSGNSRNLTQATTTIQPQLLLNQQNGLPMLSSSSKMLSLASWQADNLTALWVASLNSASGIQVLSQLGYYDFALVSGNLQISDSGVKSITNYAYASTAMALHSAMVSYSAPNATGTLRRNGSQQSQTTASRTATTTGISLGNSAINFPWNGLIGEFLLFDTVRADVASIETAINSAWAVY